MYSVDDRDSVHDLPDVPRSSVGAPLPLVVASEHRLFLAYLVESRAPGWDGSTVRVVSHRSPDQPTALVEFVRPAAHCFGPPNDEAFEGHPLAARGLHPYGAFEVRDSSWIRALERMNRVHPHHRPEHFAGLRHYVFAFHDSTFECVAEGLHAEERRVPLTELLPEMQRRVTT
jgi:hypothetical protein